MTERSTKAAQHPSGSRLRARRRSPMRWRSSLCGAAVAAVAALSIAVTGLGPAASGATASGATTPVSSAIRPLVACADLAGDYGIPGTQAHVTAATVAPAA